MNVRTIDATQARARATNTVVGSSPFGKLIRQWRKTENMSQVTLASLVDCHQTYVSELEWDKRLPSRRVVLMLARVFGLTTSQTDRLLFAAGYASQIDYQTLYEARHGAVDEQQKWCPRCQSSLLTAQFSRDRVRYDSLHPICKSCESVRGKEYRKRIALSGRRAS